MLTYLKSRALTTALVAAAVLAAGAGCKKQDEIRAYNAPKDPPPVSLAQAPDQGNAPASQREGTPHWTLPTGWKELSPGQMRFATIAVNDEQPPLTVAVTRFPATGQMADVLANVNRWARELALSEYAQADLPKVVSTIGTPDGLVQVIDLTSKDNQRRTIAAMAERGPSVWFFKLTGPAEKVAAQKSNFDDFLRSMHFDYGGSHGRAATQSPTSKPATPSTFAYTLPEGWRHDPTPREMRELTFFVGPADKQAELIVSRFDKDNVGNFASNINRWRAQVGLPQMQAEREAIDSMQEIAIAGGPGILVDLAAPDNSRRLLVGMAMSRGEFWFFKLLGPGDTVASQEKAFRTFLESGRFEPKAGK